ncbi:hypothetical protein ALC57_16350, partial [Trachymyrmex cornetzi]
RKWSPIYQRRQPSDPFSFSIDAVPKKGRSHYLAAESNRYRSSCLDSGERAKRHVREIEDPRIRVSSDGAFGQRSA